MSNVKVSAALSSGMSRPVLEKELRAVPTPAPTETWNPLPHGLVVDLMREAVQQVGMKVVEERYAVSKETKVIRDGARLFGVMIVDRGVDDFQLALGFRNSHDKEFALGVCAGSRVFVCDNMCFVGDLKLKRKHTQNIMEDVRFRLSSGMQGLLDIHSEQVEQYSQWKETPMGDMQFHDFAVRSALQGIVAPSKVVELAQHWHTPPHPEFAARTLWSGVNTVTEALKGSNPFFLQDKTKLLYQLAGQVASNN